MDIQRYCDRLVEAGVDKQQAVAMTHALEEAERDSHAQRRAKLRSTINQWAFICGWTGVAAFLFIWL